MNKTYYVDYTNSKGAILLGEAANEKECWDIIFRFFDKQGIKSYYQRVYATNNVICVDFGSYSHFIEIRRIDGGELTLNSFHDNKSENETLFDFYIDIMGRKSKVMKELIDLYEQYEFIDKNSAVKQEVFKSIINKENELKELLNF